MSSMVVNPLESPLKELSENESVGARHHQYSASTRILLDPWPPYRKATQLKQLYQLVLTLAQIGKRVSH